jgi:hypothetical protein
MAFLRYSCIFWQLCLTLTHHDVMLSRLKVTAGKNIYLSTILPLFPFPQHHKCLSRQRFKRFAHLTRLRATASELEDGRDSVAAGIPHGNTMPHRQEKR